MPAALKFGFTPFARPRGVLVVFCEENLKFGPATQRTLAPIGELLRRAAAAIDGVLVPAGAVFSFWKQIGRASWRRGFAPTPIPIAS